MYRIIYLSTATANFTTEEIISLLNISRKYNQIYEITGLLLYSEGNFLQIIEGKRKPLHKLYENITRDSRHRNIIKVFDEKVKSRIYPDWNMGFSNIDKDFYKTNKGFHSFKLDQHGIAHEPFASTFVETFLKSNRNRIMIK